jgi:hypothetical protein
MDVNEIGCDIVDWIQLTHDQWRALMNTIMNLRLLRKVSSFLTSCATVTFSIGTLLLGVT